MAPDALGLIAGRGVLPLEIARAARARGRSVAAVGLRGLADPELERAAEGAVWVEPGRLSDLLSALAAAGVREAVVAGSVPKARLLAEGLADDALVGELLARLADRRDGTLLSALADLLASRGVTLRPQAESAPELLGREGPLGRSSPDAEARADVAFAWPVARAVADLDVGQTVVVKDRVILAVEAAEGTDATLRRAGRMARGARALKVARSAQDPRFDLPAVGPDTVAALRAARASALAFEADRTLVLAREDTVRAADAAGIAIFGVRGDG